MCSAIDFLPFPPDLPLTPAIEQLPCYASAICCVDFLVAFATKTDQIFQSEKIIRSCKLDVMNFGSQSAAKFAESVLLRENR